ncbi:hypothetical protein JAAARDRAFT_31259 [Jaapia argillacea MUCL 33604]|uniref:Uncharacterized protein n=1 Tax=Jaapia argillacea MUCL 33604 TaxID=933084 RepID=A0A067Q3Z0_9AGAM|nr:hypothetical protein JAAARDRAFT_31259 [Jaapia argillacea MUCL 33604]
MRRILVMLIIVLTFPLSLSFTCWIHVACTLRGQSLISSGGQCGLAIAQDGCRDIMKLDEGPNLHH